MQRRARKGKGQQLGGVVLLALLASCGGNSSDTTTSDAEPSATAQADTSAAPRVGIEHPGPGKPRLLGTIAYACEDGAVVVTELDGRAGGLWIHLPDGKRLLPQVPAASGSRYSDGEVSVWSKGTEATIETAAGVRTCQEDRRLSVLEDARLRGVVFRATGNEPGWKLEIGPEYTVLETDHGQTRYTLRTGTPSIDVAGHTSYVARVDDVAIRIVLAPTPCTDSMSGVESASRVTVSVDDTTLHGCGDFLQ